MASEMALTPVSTWLGLDPPPYIRKKRINQRTQCWMGINDNTRRLHIITAPWKPFSGCGGHLANRHIHWGTKPSAETAWTPSCANCCYWQRSLPWYGLIPQGWDPPKLVEEAHVLADWWEERGGDKQADKIRSYCENPLDPPRNSSTNPSNPEPDLCIRSNWTSW